MMEGREHRWPWMAPVVSLLVLFLTLLGTITTTRVFLCRSGLCRVPSTPTSTRVDTSTHVVHPRRMFGTAGDLGSRSGQRRRQLKWTVRVEEQRQEQEEEGTDLSLQLPSGLPRPSRFQFSYGPHPDQCGDLYLPGGKQDGRRWPVIVLIHGGFWSNKYGRDLMGLMATEIASARYGAVLNIEFRRAGHGSDGGFPNTLLDIAAAMDHIPTLGNAYPLDPTRVVAVGHSSGGHLALWSSMRANLPSGAPGANPIITPSLVVSQSGVCDLKYAYEKFVGGYAVPLFLGSTGGGRVDPMHLMMSDPSQLLPTPSKLVLLHSEHDQAIPISMSQDFASLARDKGTDATFTIIPGEDHFAFLSQRTRAFAGTMNSIQSFLYPEVGEDLRRGLEEQSNLNAFIEATHNPRGIRSSTKAMTNAFDRQQETRKNDNSNRNNDDDDDNTNDNSTRE